MSSQSTEKNKEAFKKFIDVLTEVTQNDEEVIRLVEKRYSKANPHFIYSPQFLHLLKTVQRKIERDDANKYVFLKELCDELKAYDQKHATGLKRKNPDSDSESSVVVSSVKSVNSCKNDRSQHSISITGSSFTRNEPKQKRIRLKGNDKETGGSCSDSNKKDEHDEEIKFVDCRSVHDVDSDIVEIESSVDGVVEQASKPGEISANDKNETDEAEKDIVEIMDDDDDSDSQAEDQRSNLSIASNSKDTDASKNDSTESKKREKKIKKYQHFLMRLDKQIKSMEEREIDLDELEDDPNYLTIDKWKRTFVKHWKRLCELQERNPTSGRPIERKFKCNATRFLEINKRIQKFVNKKKIFPDYSDILSIVQKCNSRYNLGMSKSLVDMVSRDAFTEVGNQLQQRRREDYDCAFGSHLTDTVRDYDDPALFDIELRRKLESNQKKSKSRLDDLIKKYAYKQEHEGDVSGDEDENDEDEDEIVREEEERITAIGKKRDNTTSDGRNEAKYESSDQVDFKDNAYGPLPLELPDDHVASAPFADEPGGVEREVLGNKTDNRNKAENITSDKQSTTGSSCIEIISLKDVLDEPPPMKTNAPNKTEYENIENQDSNKPYRGYQDEKGTEADGSYDVEVVVDDQSTELVKGDDQSTELVVGDDQSTKLVVGDDQSTGLVVCDDQSTKLIEPLKQKPVSSPRIRKGLLNLKHLKHPDMLLEKITKDTEEDVPNNFVLPTSDKCIIELSSASSEEEETYPDGGDDLGCFPLDSGQKEFGTPFRRQKRLKENVQKVPEKNSGTEKRTVSEINGAAAVVENTSNKKVPESKNSHRRIMPTLLVSNAETPIRRYEHEEHLPNRKTKDSHKSRDKHAISEQVSVDSKLENSEKSGYVCDPIVIEDDKPGGLEPVVNLHVNSPTYSAKSTYRRESKEYYDEATSAVGISQTANYTYKKVVKETSVSSTSSNPNETVVHSSKKTVVRKTPVDTAHGSKPVVYKSTTEKKTTLSPGPIQHAHQHISGHGIAEQSALSGFKRTMRKKKSDTVDLKPSKHTMSDDIRKDAQKVVVEVLEKNPIIVDTFSLSGDNIVYGNSYTNSNKRANHSEITVPKSSVVKDPRPPAKTTAGSLHNPQDHRRQGSALAAPHPRVPLATLAESVYKPPSFRSGDSESFIILSDSD